MTRITPSMMLLAVTSILLVTGASLIALGRHNEPAAHVEVRDIWLSAERYEGRTVVAEGTLRIFLAGTIREHYAIEDEQQFRVGVRNVASEQLARLLNRPVEVEGILRVTGDRGIYIDAEHVYAVDASVGMRDAYLSVMVVPDTASHR